MYWFYISLFIHKDRANNKTTTTTLKKLINSEKPRGRRPVTGPYAGKDPQKSRISPAFAQMVFSMRLMSSSSPGFL
ncbi:hypothetical protein NMW20_25930, partial [Escherichia coli]|nr:hypothetical protein [Escherichia coli]